MALTTAVAFAGISASLIALGGERHFPLRPLIGDGSRARLLRAFLPLAPAVVIAEGLFFRLVPATNPALHAALLSLLLAVVVSLGAARSARTVARALDEIKEERWRRGQAERETREKALVLVESQRVARIGSYRGDLITGTWTGSAVLYEIFGVDDPPSIGTIQDWLSVIHPDDRGDMEAYFTDEVVGQCKPFEREYRIRRPNDHEVRWVRGLGELLLDEAGRPVELVGSRCGACRLLGALPGGHEAAHGARHPTIRATRTSTSEARSARTTPMSRRRIRRRDCFARGVARRRGSATWATC